MCASRWALLLAGCLLPAPSTYASTSIERHATPAGVVADCRADASQNWQLDGQATRPTTVAPFAPWRARLKSVLGETDYKGIIESDLGPVLAQSRLISTAILPLSACQRSIILPLRC
jgi:hypothetical protein